MALRLSPMVAQFELAARIRQRREDLALGAAAVAAQLQFTRNYYSMVENGRSLLAAAKLRSLAEVLRFEPQELDELAELLEQARTAGWWQAYAQILDPVFVRYLGLEAGAAVIRSFEASVFHGLLQSPDYAEAIIAAAVDYRADWFRRTVDVRLRRQEILHRPSPPGMLFAFSEAVLLQHYGSAEVLRGQLRHVLELADEVGPTLDLRVRPFDVTPRGLGAAATLVLLEFDSPHLAPVAYREAGYPISIADQAEVVSRLQVAFNRMLESCLDRAGSLALIERRMRELG